MFQFGSGSQSKLATVHPDLKAVFDLAITRTTYDFTIVHGWRGEEVQNALEASGASTKRYPDSRHNKTDDPTIENPGFVSDAVDFAPYIDGKIPWGETHIFAHVAGVIMAAAVELGVGIRWGGDWDGDGNTKEHKLQDWGHVERVQG